MGCSYVHLPTVLAGSTGKGGLRVTRTRPCFFSGRCWRMFIPYVLDVSRESSGTCKLTMRQYPPRRRSIWHHGEVSMSKSNSSKLSSAPRFHKRLTRIRSPPDGNELLVSLRTPNTPSTYPIIPMHHSLILAPSPRLERLFLHRRHIASFS